MKMTLLNTANGYVPSYTQTEITDFLHQTFGFRTDYEFIKKSTMRSIIKQTKADWFKGQVCSINSYNKLTLSYILF